MEQEKEESLKTLEYVLGAYGFSPVITWALRFFFRNPYESLVLVNKDGRLDFLDRVSEEALGIPQGGARGTEVEKLFPESNLPEVLRTGVPFLGRVFNLKGALKMGSTYPLIKDGEIIGGIGRLIFRPFEEIERMSAEIWQLKSQVNFLRETAQHNQNSAHYTFNNILGVSTAITDAVDMAKKVATIDSDVLIAGESGTGKEIFAHAIHNAVDPRKPFVQVNSSAIPFELAESELFGYEKGSFTGAKATGKPGKFELAHNGTFFLDEVGSLPLSIQAKLLRVFQEREIARLGGASVQKVNFRLIAATNTDLKKLVKEGKFREDLYFRIAKVNIVIPALRERKDDIPVYINHFLKTINERFGTKFKRLSNEALFCFMNYGWPGNVRELINFLEQACLKKWEGEEIFVDSLPYELVSSPAFHHSPSVKTLPGSSEIYKNELAGKEIKLILQALENTKGNKRRAALLLGIPRSTLYKKLKDHSVAV